MEIDLLLIIAWIGYLLAIWLYYGLGKIFWVPIALDLLYDFAGSQLGIWGNNLQTLVTMTIYDILLLLWVIYMSGILKTRAAIWIVLGLLLVATFNGVTAVAIAQGIGVSRFAEIVGLPGIDQIWILLTTQAMYTWSAIIFLIVIGIIVHSTIIRRLRGRPALFLTNPRIRIIIPIGLYTGIIGLSQLYQGFVPEAFYQWRYRIAGTALGWGWVAMELPFYIMYRRMIRSD